MMDRAALGANIHDDTESSVVMNFTIPLALR
jgi:hypothetical protein